MQLTQEATDRINELQDMLGVNILALLYVDRGVRWDEAELKLYGPARYRMLHELVSAAIEEYAALSSIPQ